MSTLAIHSNGHTDVPTPQSLRWWLQLPARQLGLQQNISWRWELGVLPTSNNLGQLYDPKETASFFSHRWNVGNNLDLVFASFGQVSLLPDRRVLGKFPRSQHRPSLITPPKLEVPAHSHPVKRWNFRKADWKHFCLLTDKSVERLPPPDTSNIERAYQDFCESLLSAAKRSNPRGRRKDYVPCWDNECETLYHRDREPMTGEPDVALLMTASGSIDIFLTRFLRMKLFLKFFIYQTTKPSATPCSTRSGISSKKHVIKEKIQTFAIVQICWFTWKFTHWLVS